MEIDKVRENYLRRWAGRLGMLLKKSRGRLWSVENQGGYMIVDPAGSSILHGERYELTIEDVERILTESELALKTA